MRQVYALIATLVLTLSVAAVPATAVTDGELDGNAHPYVGLMVAQDADGNPLWRCSGTLISAKVFLTAGHCTEAPAAHVEIWFDADVGAGRPGNGYPFDGDAGGTPQTHPQYDPNAFFLFDLGVVVLDKPVKMKTYGTLPELDANNAHVAANPGSAAVYTAVGYGLQRINPVFVEAELVRMFAMPHIIQIDSGIAGDFSLLLSNNHSTGGTCFGDSGGPNFIGTSSVIGGVTSFGLNGNCAGTGGVYRVDRADDLEWLATFGFN
ncbi:MAG: trypsin-like serine protease [Candidatus Limnocylindria bacterium]